MQGAVKKAATAGGGGRRRRGGARGSATKRAPAKRAPKAAAADWFPAYAYEPYGQAAEEGYGYGYAPVEEEEEQWGMGEEDEGVCEALLALGAAADALEESCRWAGLGAGRGLGRGGQGQGCVGGPLHQPVRSCGWCRAAACAGTLQPPGSPSRLSPRSPPPLPPPSPPLPAP